MKGRTPSTDDTDESLMRLIVQGSHQAFVILVHRYTDRFFATAFRLTGRVADAEDLVQEAFLKVWNRPDLWNEEKGVKFTTWFYRILVNQNIDRMRKDGRLVSGEEMFPLIADGRNDPEEDAIMSEEQRRVEAAMATLPERQRTALTLCFYEGLSNAEASDVMGVRTKALESLLMRAKAGLRQYMSQRHRNPDKGGLYGTG